MVQAKRYYSRTGVNKRALDAVEGGKGLKSRVLRLMDKIDRQLSEAIRHGNKGEPWGDSIRNMTDRIRNAIRKDNVQFLGVVIGTLKFIQTQLEHSRGLYEDLIEELKSVMDQAAETLSNAKSQA